MLDIKGAGTEGSGPDNPYAKLRAPGEIQGFGVLAALHPTTLRVLSASENVATEIGIPHASFLGRSLYDLITGDDAIAHIKECVASDAPVFENSANRPVCPLT